jgi:outer membrane autotransporter protein
MAEGDRAHAGLMGTIGRGEADVTHLVRIGAGEDDFTAYSLGGYWTWYGASVWYVHAILQGTWYDMEARPGRLPSSETDGFGIAGSLEGGYPLSLGDGWIVEPQIQGIWQSLDLDEMRDIGATVRFDEETSLAGRIGLRIARTWLWGGFGEPAPVTAWFRPNLWYEFEGDPTTSFSSATGFIPFRARLGGSWLELNTGVSTRLDELTSLYANGSYDIGLSADGEAYDGKVGVRVNW